MDSSKCKSTQILFTTKPISGTQKLKLCTVISPQASNEDLKTVYCGDQYLRYSPESKSEDQWIQCDTNKQNDASNWDLVTLDYKHIKEFAESNLKITKIFKSSSRLFALTKANKIYASGNNSFGELGINVEDTFIKPLTKVDTLCDKNVFDIQMADEYSLALCGSDKQSTVMIIENWCRTTLDRISKDVIQLIVNYVRQNVVYSTMYGEYGGNGHGINDQTKKHKHWKIVKALEDSNIVKIRCGNQFSMFLDSDGVLWTAGRNDPGGFCGDNWRCIIYKPVKISYFITNKIEVVDIVCGQFHTLAMDNNGKIYSWGRRGQGQCGDGNGNPSWAYWSKKTPAPIEYFEDQVIEAIGCGYLHSYCKTIENKHYLFGDNQDYQCLKPEGKWVSEYCVNDVVKKESDRDIERVFVQAKCTVIILAEK